MDKSPSPFFNQVTTLGDIRSKEEILLPHQTQAVVLLAAEHRDDVNPTNLYYDVNVIVQKNVLDKMDEEGIKQLVFTSSVAIYGLNKQNPSENHPEDPFNDYGKSKWQAEQVIKEWFEKDPIGKSVTIIRPTVIFGERNRGNVYNLLKQNQLRKVFDDWKGSNKKSMTYVGNVVSFIIDRLQKKESGFQVFNYADKPTLIWKSLFRLLRKRWICEYQKQKSRTK